MDGCFLNKKAKVKLVSSLRQKRGLENENKGTEQPVEEWQVAAELSGGLEKNQVTFAGVKAERWNAAVCEDLFLSFFLYLVLDLNFFPKALSSSGTDKVRVKEPSDSDLTTRALREHWIKVKTEAPRLVFSLKNNKKSEKNTFAESKLGRKTIFGLQLEWNKIDQIQV